MNRNIVHIQNNSILRQKILQNKLNQQRQQEIKDQLNKSKQINTFHQQKDPKLENLIIGTQRIKKNFSEQEFRQSLYKYKEQHHKDSEAFKDKKRYLTNKPYKAIHDINVFVKPIEKEDDLIVYKPSPNDKDKREIEKRITGIINDRKQHDMELRKLYVISKQREYQTRFNNEITKRYKLIPQTQKNQEQLKKDAYKYHEQCQKVLEEDRKNVDLIINELIDKPLFTLDDKKTIIID